MASDLGASIHLHRPSFFPEGTAVPEAHSRFTLPMTESQLTVCLFEIEKYLVHVPVELYEARIHPELLTQSKS